LSSGSGSDWLVHCVLSELRVGADLVTGRVLIELWLGCWLGCASVLGADGVADRVLIGLLVGC
jgi:hypothetical protein